MTSKKQTLQESFFSEFGEMLCEAHKTSIWNFFKPHLKKTPTKKVKFDIPKDKLEEFNNLWPTKKLSTGKYGRCSMLELESAFQFFFTSFPTFTNWDIIIEAARIYLSEREQENFEYTRRAKYFVRREARDKSWESELSEYYQRIQDGTQDEPEENRHSGFEPKIY